jgi:hypothetical protein
MPYRDRRQAAEALSALEQLIERMETLGRDAEDAAGRITVALGGNLAAGPNTDHQQLVAAVCDVIDINTERSKLAHEAYRVITDLRRRESELWRQSRS